MANKIFIQWGIKRVGRDDAHKELKHRDKFIFPKKLNMKHKVPDKFIRELIYRNTDSCVHTKTYANYSEYS